MIGQELQSNVRDNATATLSSGITLNASTSTLILAASDDTRIKVIVYNDGNQNIWVKLQAASVDDDKKGFVIPNKSFRVVIEQGDIYTGEISAIAVSDAPVVHVTSY